MVDNYTKVSWKPAEKKEEDLDRDERYMAFARTKGTAAKELASRTPGGCTAANWGGAMRRMTSTLIGPSREDEAKVVRVPGRYVPIGFARYVSPVPDPADYEYWRIAGWRVAIPRSTPSQRVKQLLYRIFKHGPQSAGYVRMGDTLVPAILETGDRMSLAQTAIEWEPYPLSQ
jgi:hypothetical protein